VSCLIQADATLIPLDPRMSTLDDWELLLALHHRASTDALVARRKSLGRPYFFRFL
jgi:hypothetical protein